MTPHIGFNTKPLLLSNFKKAKRPGCHCKTEAKLVLKCPRNLMNDEKRKEMIQFFDSNQAVRVEVDKLHASRLKIISCSFRVYSLQGMIQFYRRGERR